MNDQERLRAYERRLAAAIEEEGLLPPGKDVVVLVSGGKDSTALSILLEEYRKGKNLSISYLNVVFPQDLFGNDLLKAQRRLGKNLSSFTSIIPGVPRDILAKEKQPCQRCKAVRTEEIARRLKHHDQKRLVIITGHTQDDLIAYAAEFFGKDLRAVTHGKLLKDLPTITIRPEHEEHFSRCFPKMTFKNGITLAKPLLGFNRREVLDILRIAKAERNTTRCLYEQERPKRNIFHTIDTLPKEEARTLYETYATSSIRKALKEHVKNHDDLLTTIKEQDYVRFLL